MTQKVAIDYTDIMQENDPLTEKSLDAAGEFILIWPGFIEKIYHNALTLELRKDK
jgi:hypothetical protein